MNRNTLLEWLRETDASALDELRLKADRVRLEALGDAVHLRGLIEISNSCTRLCAYCGLNAANSELARYHMHADEILACCRQAHALGYGTVVLQAGETPAHTRDWVAALVSRIRAELPLAVTLSLGERDLEDYRAWRKAGADRYLLRFETGDGALFRRLHPGPPSSGHPRLKRLWQLRMLGFEIGGGIMVGLPGQSMESLADDLLRFAELDLDMIGIGPYIPHPETALVRQSKRFPEAAEQVPPSLNMAQKALALARILCPKANIPATTALATKAGAEGYRVGLAYGANVIMPDLTPLDKRMHYAIYPGKAGAGRAIKDEHRAVCEAVSDSGRTLGNGRGDSPAFADRQSRICREEAL